MILSIAIKQIYPDIDFNPEGTDVLLEDEGSGVYIKEWNYSQPQPTVAELEAAWAAWEAGAVDRARAAAVVEVNRQAGEARSRVGTNIPFQGDLYQMKGDEAARWAVDTEPTTAKYPIMYAEAAARGMEPAAVQAEYAYNAQAWPQIMAAIEAVRMSSRAALAAAESVEEIAEILAAVVWPV